MAISYFYIKKECALRSAQLTGTGQATLESSYVSGSFDSVLDGAEVPASSFRTQILNIEQELVHIIASDASHPYRTFLYARSEDLANLASTPAYDNNGSPFFGVFDSVADSNDNRPLTVMPTETLTDYENAFFNDTNLYNYCIVGNTIQHTRPLAYLQGCSWDITTQTDAYNDDLNSPLPNMLANTWIAGVIAALPQVGWTDQAGVAGTYNTLYQQGIQILRMGASGEVNLPLASRANVATG